jgi:predicted DNA binding protein
MNLLKLGIYHHGCWFSQLIEKFPHLHIKEIGSRSYHLTNRKKINEGLWQIIASSVRELEEAISFLKKQKPITKLVLLQKGKTTLTFSTTWIAQKTSYDQLLKEKGIYASNCYSHRGLETYNIYLEEGKDLKKLIEELGGIGEAKILRLEKAEEKLPYQLTPKQLSAITRAVNAGYYSWPKKVHLDQLAAQQGEKRRAFQNNLRKAEEKVLPELLNNIF